MRLEILFIVSEFVYGLQLFLFTVLKTNRDCKHSEYQCTDKRHLCAAFVTTLLNIKIFGN
jgi:hypothetical protein